MSAALPKIEHFRVADLRLDPRNPRLGRRNTDKALDQSAILAIMREWTLDELAVSFIESGFWPQEALLVVEENWREGTVHVVVEGNRRLAALRLLAEAWSGAPTTQKWCEIAERASLERRKELKRVPTLRMPSRGAVTAYLGFRHVTGIAQWRPAEKAEFITKLIEDDQLTYDQVRRRIGSKTPTVRQNYISYRLLLQLDELDESDNRVDVDRVEERFSVLYLSIRTEGVQRYLDIDIRMEPHSNLRPVPENRLKQLANFANWLFGNKDTDPIVADSRQIDEFGRVLESEAAVEYL